MVEFKTLWAGTLLGKEKIDGLVICVGSRTAGIEVHESLSQGEVSQGASGPQASLTGGRWNTPGLRHPDAGAGGREDPRGGNACQLEPMEARLCHVGVGKALIRSYGPEDSCRLDLYPGASG